MATDAVKKALHDAPLALVASRIHEARDDAGLTLDGLGGEIGSSRHHLIRLEKGVHRPRVEMLERIAGATGKPIDWFLDQGADADPFQPRGKAAA